MGFEEEGQVGKLFVSKDEIVDWVVVLGELYTSHYGQILVASLNYKQKVLVNCRLLKRQSKLMAVETFRS